VLKVFVHTGRLPRRDLLSLSIQSSINDRIRHGPKSLKERPIRGFLRKLAFSWSAWAEAHPTHCRRTGPVLSAAPSWSRFRPLVPGSSRAFRARCSCAREPCGRDGRPSATAPGPHEPPWAHAPEPPLLWFSPPGPSPRRRALDPWDRRSFWSRHCYVRWIPALPWGVRLGRE